MKWANGVIFGTEFDCEKKTFGNDRYIKKNLIKEKNESNYFCNFTILKYIFLLQFLQTHLVSISISEK